MRSPGSRCQLLVSRLTSCSDPEDVKFSISARRHAPHEALVELKRVSRECVLRGGASGACRPITHIADLKLFSTHHTPLSDVSRVHSYILTD